MKCIRNSRQLIAHLAALVVLVGCGVGAGSTDGGTRMGGAGANSVDAGATVTTYPGWQLTDLQPASPRFNTSYGLQVFAGRPLVLILLEGY